jgi:hypothetical protein
VVELASLDSLNCPIDKLYCLQTTLDLILAELKGAIVDAHSVLSREYSVNFFKRSNVQSTFFVVIWYMFFSLVEDSQLPALGTDDLIPLLVTVIIQAKPLHMASNLYYMENFQWTLSPSDAIR